MFRILNEKQQTAHECLDLVDAMRAARRMVRQKGRAFFVVDAKGRHLSTHAPWGKLPERPVFARMAS